MKSTVRISSCVLSLLSIFSLSVSGQNAISTSGGNASGTGGKAAYTIGQVAYSQVTGANGSVIQGVQQPYEISVITAAENTEDISLTCVVYPNPASSHLNLVIGGFNGEKIKYSIYNLNGLLLADNEIEATVTSISLDQFQAGIYFLRIVSEGRKIKLFRIIKK